MPHCQAGGEDKPVFNAYMQGDFQRVIRLASAAISRIRRIKQTRQRRHLLHQVRGQAFASIGFHTKAIEELTEAIRLNNSCNSAHSNRANSFFNAGRYEEALSDHDRAIALTSPNEVPFDFLRNRGRCLHILGRHDEALSGYKEASLLFPNEHIAWYDRALLLISQGRLHEAIADLTKGLKVRPIGYLFLKRARVFESLDRHREALADYSRAIDFGIEGLTKQQDPRFPAAETPSEVLSIVYSHRGMLRRMLGDHDGELSDLSNAIRYDPEYRVHRYNRGQTYKLQFRYREALIDFDKAIQLDPMCPMCRHERAVIYLHTGRHEEAMADIDRAISLCPEKPLYRATREMIQGVMPEGPKRNLPEVFLSVMEASELVQRRGSSEDRMMQLSMAHNSERVREDQQGARDVAYKEVLSGVGNVKKVCAFCSNMARGRKKMQMCSRCRSARYCSQECQRRDWRRHKPTCRRADG